MFKKFRKKLTPLKSTLSFEAPNYCISKMIVDNTQIRVLSQTTLDNNLISKFVCGFFISNTALEPSQFSPHCETRERWRKISIQILIKFQLTSGMTSSAKCSISSSIGLICIRNISTPASRNSMIRSAICSGVPVNPVLSPRFETL